MPRWLKTAAGVVMVIPPGSEIVVQEFTSPGASGAGAPGARRRALRRRRQPLAAAPLAEGRPHLPGEQIHRAQDPRVVEIAEPEAAVEVRDADEIADA